MKLIITADWHIRATRPRCRIDNDWLETQRKALRQVLEISDKKGAPIMVVGDLFHSNSELFFLQASNIGVFYYCAAHSIDNSSHLDLAVS